MLGRGSDSGSEECGAAAEFLPLLSLDALRRAGALVPGRAGDWQWTHKGEAKARISLSADKGRLTLLYRFHGADGAYKTVREVVPIVRHSSGLGKPRKHFVCPGKRNGGPCKRRVEKLYPVGPYFLCRHCSQRVRSSQLSAARSKLDVGAVRKGVSFAGVGALVVSAQALAAGFMIRENSAAGVGTVFAGNGSRADSAATVFNNPAGMTLLTGNELEIGTTVILPSTKFEGAASVMGSPIPGTNGGNSGRVGFVPNAHWAFGITDRLKGGISITAPFGNAMSYDSLWSGRYLGLKTSALSVDINPNLAFRLTDNLSIGAGVSAQYMKLEMTSALPQFVMLGPGAPDAFLRFKADDWAFGFNAGALLELPAATRIGLTYRSRIDHRIEGDLDFRGASPMLGLISGPAAADLHLPATSGISITKEFSPDFSLSADVQFTQWSIFKQVIVESQNPALAIEQRYRDSWFISIGGVYRLNNVWTLRAGLGWDQTPIRETFRAVNLPDMDRYLVGAGFGYRLTDGISLDAGYEHSFAFKRADISKSFNNTDLFTHAIALNGKYDVDVDVVAMSLRFKF